MLSSHDIPLQLDFLFAFVGFWSTPLNGFVFSFSMLSPTLLDVAAITGLPLRGEEPSALHTTPIEDLKIKFSKITCSYTSFQGANEKHQGPVIDGEHNVFLLLWFCKYFICSNSVAVVQEFQLVISLFVFGANICLDSLFLSLLYRSLYTLLDALEVEKEMKTVPGPLWFLQLWIILYFPEFISFSFKAPSLLADCTIMAERLCLIPVSKKNSFEVANTLFLMTSRASHDWCPILNQRFGPSWLFTPHEQASSPQQAQDITLDWGKILTARDLLCGARPTSRNNKSSAKFYNPQCFARQFGLLQNIPATYESMVSTLDRPIFSGAIVFKLSMYNQKQLNAFQYVSTAFAPSETTAFLNWWPSMKDKCFPEPPSIYLNRLINENSGGLAVPATSSKQSRPPKPTIASQPGFFYFVSYYFCLRYCLDFLVSF